MAGAARPIAIQALGVGIDVRCAGEQAERAAAELTGRWALCRPARRRTPAAELEVRLDDASDAGLARFLVDVTHQVTFAAITANIGRLLMFHAAGVCDQDTGATVVFVAPGGTGKTTVCRELGPGRGYVSDETIGVAPDGSIRPYPKPLSVRRPGGSPKSEIAPESLGLAPAAVTPYVAAVLLLARSDQGPQLPVVERLDPFRAITHLAPETSSLDRLDRPLHRLHDLLSGVSLLGRVRYREALTLEPLVAQLIGAPATGRAVTA